MDFTLQRSDRGSEGVFGDLLSSDGTDKFSTCERAYLVSGAWVAKLAAGFYACSRYFSPDHGYELFVVRGVPDFQGQPVSYIELHVGNFNIDSKGCVLLGLSRAGNAITQSRSAFKAFMLIQQGVQEFKLTVRDPEIPVAAA